MDFSRINRENDSQQVWPMSPNQFPINRVREQRINVLVNRFLIRAKESQILMSEVREEV